MTRLALPPLLLLLAATSGCSSLAGWTDTLNPFDDPYVRADAENPAVEVACIWQPGEGRTSQGIPARGFSGQVFFFTGRDEEPALVHGTMRVYLFADRGTPEERAKPLHQYDFAPEAWDAHATKTSLGPGYSVFIPYPASEPYQVRCQLRARFTPATGQPLWSEAVAMTLEGPPRPDQAIAMAAGTLEPPAPPIGGELRFTQNRVPASELNADDARSPEPRRLRTDTFRLGDVEQTAYEAPDPSAADLALNDLDSATLRRMLKDASRRKSSASHPLDAAEPAVAETHPLQGSTAPRRPRAPIHSRERQTTAEEPQADQPRLRLPGRPATGRSSISRPHPLAGDSPSQLSDATQVRVSETRRVAGSPTFDRPSADFGAAADFGTWQRQGE